MLKNHLLTFLTHAEWGREKPAARDYLDGHPSGYQVRETLLNFSDPWGTGAFNVLSPLTESLYMRPRIQIESLKNTQIGKRVIEYTMYERQKGRCLPYSEDIPRYSF
ncbi:hypothetical protein M8J77_004320 [Diaphorina citri]|nr:hypothetical protein M8J77_004320 [Diaphorina citri]